MSVHLERVAYRDVPWAELDTYPKRSIFQTREWLDFLLTTQTIEPVVAMMLDGSVPKGWFIGGITRRAGLKILGSPLPGWTTSYMGFVTSSPPGTHLLLGALREFAFDSLGCVHLEVMDRDLPFDALANLPRTATTSTFHSYELELADNDTMLAGMSQNARRNIRRSSSRSMRVEEVDMAEAPLFVDQLYAQLCQAFAKRDLRPAFSKDRIFALIEHLEPTGNLLMLRSVTPQGLCAGTGVFPGLADGTAFFWMGASDRSLLDGRPNEAIMWRAITTWRDRGARTFDFGGGGTYKEKYGGDSIEVPWIRWSRFAGLDAARSSIQRLVRFRQRIR